MKDKSHLEGRLHAPAISEAALLVIGRSIHGSVFSEPPLVMTDKAKAYLMSMMDAITTQIYANAKPDAQNDQHMAANEANNVHLGKLSEVFARPELTLFLFCRYWEWCLVKAFGTTPANGHPGHVTDFVIDQINTARAQSEADSEFVAIVNATSRFAHNMDQMDISISELPAEILSLLLQRLEDVDLLDSKLSINLPEIWDEEKARLPMLAKCVMRYPVQHFSHTQWHYYGPVHFLLSLCQKLQIAYDNALVATAISSPLPCAELLLAAGASLQDIVLIMAEMPNADIWMSGGCFADALQNLDKVNDLESLKNIIRQWDASEQEKGIPLAGHWPWHSSGVPS